MQKNLCQRENKDETKPTRVLRKSYPHCYRRQTMIKGYIIPEGFMGLVKGKYQLFASENDYLEYVLVNEEVQHMLDYRDFYYIADGKLYVKDGMARLSESLAKDDQVTIEMVQSDCEMQSLFYCKKLSQKKGKGKNYV